MTTHQICQSTEIKDLTMLNITVLDNFSEEVMNEFMNVYDMYFQGKDLRQNYSNLFYISNVNRDVVDKINAKLPMPAASIQLYFFDPRRGRGQPHIDRGRKTAFQIPVLIDTENSYTFSFNNTDISLLKPRGEYSHYASESVNFVNNPKHWFYEWNDTLFDKYSLEKPILQNAAQPHGGANFSEKNRIFFSCSYKEDFDTMKKHFSEWI